jgi:hypothetical protein
MSEKRNVSEKFDKEGGILTHLSPDQLTELSKALGLGEAAARAKGSCGVIVCGNSGAA